MWGVMRLSLLFSATAFITFGAVRAADACAVFTDDKGNAPVSDHEMMLVLTPQSTTLYDQVRYTGSPASFGWVLPVKGTVTIGLSADAAFGTIDALTASSVIPPAGCPIPDSCELIPGAFGPDAGASVGGWDGVNVTQHMVIGPYETVVLSASDPNALSAWLQKNGYVIPQDVQPLFATYVSEGFDFVAMKLVPNAGVDRMRPVRVTTQGAMAQIPLRAVAAGTGSSVGVTIWILSQGYYEPTNFPTFYVGGKDVTWDFAMASSDFDQVRANRAAALGGLGLEIESESEIESWRLKRGIQNYGMYEPDGMKTALDVMTEDLNVLTGAFGETIHVTRLRGDLSRTALDKDLQLSAAANQNGLPKDRVVARVINKVCTDECPSGFRKKSGLSNGAGGGGCDASGNAATSWVSGLVLVGLVLARRSKK
jgi:hypothetical protein